MISRRLFLSALAALPLVKWARGRSDKYKLPPGGVLMCNGPSETHWLDRSGNGRDLVYPNGSTIHVRDVPPEERMDGPYLIDGRVAFSKVYTKDGFAYVPYAARRAGRGEP